MRTPGEVTRILSAIESGDPQAAEQLLPLVYDERRKLAAQKLAQEKPGQTLQATALVHEAYLRLVEAENVLPWHSRGHFFAAAAEAMRRILIDRAREEQGVQAWRQAKAADPRRAEADTTAPPDALLALDEPRFFPMFRLPTRPTLRLRSYGDSHACRLKRCRGTCQAGRRRRPRVLGGADEAVSIAAAPDGELPDGPAAPGSS
jgi:hypothetical protein